MQPELLRVLRMQIERILAEVFPDETGAARTQQVGIFAMIFMLQGDQRPVTAARLAAMTGLQSGQVQRHLKKLLDIGLVERTAITSPHGRGRAWHLTIRHTPETAKLVKALLNGAKGSGRRQAGAKRAPK
jgi:DNA-binding MarR family transcriptional regulator